MEKYGKTRHATDDTITRRIRFTCCITKHTGTNAEYVIITALPLKQWLRERASMLHLYGTVCHVYFCTQPVDGLTICQNMQLIFCLKNTVVF